MSKNQDTLKDKIYNYLKGLGYEPEMLSSSGKEVPVVEETDIFRFTFHKDGESYGTAYVSMDNSNVLTVYQSDELQNSPDETTGDPSWEQVRLQLRKMSFPLGIKSFDIRNKNHLENDMAKREYNKKLDEGYYPMGKKASYSDNIPQTKMIIQHTRNIEEGEQRYRNIARIFVENMNGERFLLPTTKPGIGRVYARHIAEGGTPYDERGQHITSLVEEYSKMAGFVRATRNGQFNESAQRLVTEGVNHYQKLRETLHKMTGKKGYSTYFESYTPPLMEDEEQKDLSEMFMSSSLDPRIECVMPILSKLSKNISEDNMKEIKSLEEWAEGVSEGDTTHKGGIVSTKGGVTKHQAGPGVYGGYDEKTHPDSPEEKHVNARGTHNKGHRIAKNEEPTTEGSYDDEDDGLIAGRYTPQQWAKMVATVKKKAQEQDAKKKMAVVSTDKPIGTRVADIGPGGKEHNVKTDAEWDKQKGMAEGVPQPGESSGAPKQFGPDAKIEPRQMTVKQIISSIPGVPYYNNVVDDWDAKDYSWGVTKKVIEYATYLKDHPESLSHLPPILVLNGKFEDGAHRVSAIWLLQQRMDPKNPLWKNAKLNVQFVKQGVAEGYQLDEGIMDSLSRIINKIKMTPGIQKFIGAAKAKQDQLIQALQHSANGKDLVANIQQAVGGQQAVAEGWGQKIGGAVAASAGGGLLAGAADIMMRAYIAMGKPDLTQMMNDPNGRNAVLLVGWLVVLGALAMLAGGNIVKKGMDADAEQPMREGQEDLDAILRIIRK